MSQICYATGTEDCSQYYESLAVDIQRNANCGADIKSKKAVAIEALYGAHRCLRCPLCPSDSRPFRSRFPKLRHAADRGLPEGQSDRRILLCLGDVNFVATRRRISLLAAFRHFPSIYHQADLLILFRPVNQSLHANGQQRFRHNARRAVFRCVGSGASINQCYSAHQANLRSNFRRTINRNAGARFEWLVAPVFLSMGRVGNATGSGPAVGV